MNDTRRCADCTAPIERDSTLDSHCRPCQDAIDYEATVDAVDGCVDCHVVRLDRSQTVEVLAPFFKATRILAEIVEEWDDNYDASMEPGEDSYSGGSAVGSGPIDDAKAVLKKIQQLQGEN